MSMWDFWDFLLALGRMNAQSGGRGKVMDEMGDLHLGFYQNFLVRVCYLLQKDWDCTGFKVQGLKNILDALSTIQGPGRAIKTGPVAE